MADASKPNVLFQSLVRVVLNEHKFPSRCASIGLLFQSLVRVVLNEHRQAQGRWMQACLQFQSLVRVVLNEHMCERTGAANCVLFQSLVRVVLNEHLAHLDGPADAQHVSIPRSGCAE